MFFKIITRSLSALSLCAFVTLMLGIANQKRDSFFAYRDFIKKPLSIEPIKLKHYAEEERMIREKLKLDLSLRERSIIAGLHWIIRVADEEKNFKMIFPDLMLLMDKMSNSHGRIHQKEIAQSIIRTSFLRAQTQLKEIFNAEEEEAGWGFIGLFGILRDFPDIKKSYVEFYKKQWPKFYESNAPEVKELAEAMAALNYKEIFDFLVQTSFFHYYITKEKNPPAKFPHDKFPEYLKEFEKFTYKNHSIEDKRFRSLGYLATHIPLVLTDYGKFPLTKSINAQKAQDYIESSFEKARQLGDFDLFAEYVQCLKIFNPGKDPRIKDLEIFIHSLQRPDGSWGSERDFKTNGYTAIHPAGAAMMALNQL